MLTGLTANCLGAAAVWVQPRLEDLCKSFVEDPDVAECISKIEDSNKMSIDESKIEDAGEILKFLKGNNVPTNESIDIKNFNSGNSKNKPTLKIMDQISSIFEKFYI